MKLVKWLFCLPIIILLSCDKGIAPETGKVDPGFSGTLTFVGEWPGNVTRTHLVLFKDPLLSEEDFNVENLIYISEEIPFGVEGYDYNTLEKIIVYILILFFLYFSYIKDLSLYPYRYHKSLFLRPYH